MDIKNYFAKEKKIVDKALKRYLPPKDAYPPQLHKAMYYSIFNGGKRIRPILAIAACQTLGGDIRQALPSACALELIHCSTLVLDDLPCMDDDDFRRGKPTCHRVFGEDIAILASSAHLGLAFEILGKSNPKIITHIAHAYGSKGLIGGQAMDLAGGDLRYIHLHKTAMLIEASVYTGAIIGNATKKQLAALTRYGRAIGLAFQISDDLLDVGSDKSEKATYPGLYGISKSKKILDSLKKEAIKNLVGFGKRAEILKGIAEYIVSRAT